MYAALIGFAVIVATLVVILYFRLMDFLGIPGAPLLFLGLLVFALAWIYDALTEPKTS